MEIDFKKLMKFNQIATQGSSRYFRYHRVTEFKLKWSIDGENWTEGEDVLKGPGKESDEIKFESIDFVARYVKFLPLKFVKHICVRLEFYGCEASMSEGSGLGFMKS